MLAKIVERSVVSVRPCGAQRPFMPATSGRALRACHWLSSSAPAVLVEGFRAAVPLRRCSCRLPSASAVLLLVSRSRGRAFHLCLAEFDDPDAAVHVVEIDHAFVRLRAPGERKVGLKAFGVTGPQMSDLASLAI